MEFEFWWLLALPVFFGLGWVTARVDLKSLLASSPSYADSTTRNSRSVPENNATGSKPNAWNSPGRSSNPEAIARAEVAVG